MPVGLLTRVIEGWGGRACMDEEVDGRVFVPNIKKLLNLYQPSVKLFLII